ncbi:MAG: 4-hydroxy-tetrahydrodipicolinate reductase [Actinobacteria bacterium]|uniref:4-hydroxy-tetrahydrodipicolinate reductase n=1 Tax=freshwater metagenome TaxID=449393 RepID=A0A6J6H2P6_9ZZZZ|nr:4-hydroxy-tetrahydrodipicolinate reductase [Actinomycetota bacterium]
MAIKVSVVGATGRMGKLALELIEAANDLELHSALDSRSDASLSDGADVIFEVTRLDVSQQVVAKAISAGQKIVVGTSGWSAARLAELNDLGQAAVVVIPNFSVGSMLATRFAAEAGKFFDSIEIVETHHAGKLDSPSGTAVRTAELISANRTTPVTAPAADQDARGQLVAGIPVHSLRLAGVSAKQDVHFGGVSELLTISHETTSVSAYSAGILAAIRFAADAQGLHVGLDAVFK